MIDSPGVFDITLLLILGMGTFDSESAEQTRAAPRLRVPATYAQRGWAGSGHADIP